MNYLVTANNEFLVWQFACLNFINSSCPQSSAWTSVWTTPPKIQSLFMLTRDSMAKSSAGGAWTTIVHGAFILSVAVFSETSGNSTDQISGVFFIMPTYASSCLLSSRDQEIITPQPSWRVFQSLKCTSRGKERGGFWRNLEGRSPGVSSGLFLASLSPILAGRN